MNKEDSIKEKFKQALQSTFKVISDDYKVVKNKNNEEKAYDIGEIDNINDKNQFKKLRAGLGLGIFIGKTLLEKNKAKLLIRNSETRGGAEIKIEWSNKDLISL